MTAKLFGWRKADDALDLINRDFFRGPKTAKKRLLNALVRRLRDETRRNITTQGNGTWPALSPWTRAQTGRRKALVTVRNKIRAKKANTSATRAAVVFDSPGNWTLTQHHDGFTEPGTGAKIKIKLRNPGILRIKGKKEVWITDRGVAVPARKVWPEGPQLRGATRDEERKWERWYRRRLASKT